MLPAVTERAVEDRAAPPAFDALDIGRAVVHPGGEKDPPRALGRPVRERDDESIAVALGARDLTLSQLNRRIALQLGPAAGIEIARSAVVVPQKPADRLACKVALAARIHHQGRALRATQNQGAAEPAGARSHDDAVAHRSARLQRVLADRDGEDQAAVDDPLGVGRHVDEVDVLERAELARVRARSPRRRACSRSGRRSAASSAKSPMKGTKPMRRRNSADDEGPLAAPVKSTLS